MACDVTAPPELCTATVLSTLLNKILVGTRYFGALYYYAQWVFLGLFILILSWDLGRSTSRCQSDPRRSGRRGRMDDWDSDSDLGSDWEEEPWEEDLEWSDPRRRLLSSSGHERHF